MSICDGYNVGEVAIITVSAGEMLGLRSVDGSEGSWKTVRGDGYYYDNEVMAIRRVVITPMSEPEPLLFAAVVRDAEGVRHVRVDNDNAPWLVENDSEGWSSYDNLSSPVTIIYPGVPADNN